MLLSALLAAISIFELIRGTTSSLSTDATSTSTSQQQQPQDHLTYLLTASNNLLTPFRISNISVLAPTLAQTPCTLLYTYASWSAHARHLIYNVNAQPLQRVAQQHKAAIAHGCLRVAVVEINEPLGEGHAVWHLIRDRAYWGSMAVVSASSQMPGQTLVPVWVNMHEWEDVDAKVKKCLAAEGCNMGSRGEDADGVAHGEL